MSSVFDEDEDAVDFDATPPPSEPLTTDANQAAPAPPPLERISFRRQSDARSTKDDEEEGEENSRTEHRHGRKRTRSRERRDRDRSTSRDRDRNRTRERDRDRDRERPRPRAAYETGAARGGSMTLSIRTSGNSNGPAVRVGEHVAYGDELEVYLNGARLPNEGLRHPVKIVVEGNANTVKTNYGDVRCVKAFNVVTSSGTTQVERATNVVAGAHAHVRAESVHGNLIAPKTANAHVNRPP